MHSQMVTAPILPYLVGAIVVAALTHLYLWRRLVHDTALGGPRARRATAVLVALAALLPTGMMGLLYMRVLPAALARPLMTTVFSYVGALFFLLVLLILAEAASLSLRPWRPRGPARRRAALALAGATLLSVGAAAQALRPLVVHEQWLHFSALPTALEGYRIVHLSDLHIGPTLGRAFVEEVVHKSNALRPQLVVITGDLVDGAPEALAALVEPLRALEAKDGVYMVLGNHEYLSGAEAWLAPLRGLGIRVLRNEQVRLGDALDLIGIDDALSTRVDGAPALDLARAFASHRRDRYTIVLSHEPSLIDEVSERGAALQLSGHTHGGQIFPLHLLEWMDQRYVLGQHRVRGTLLHVSPGAGFWGPPMRLGSQAEISLLCLSTQAPATAE